MAEKKTQRVRKALRTFALWASLALSSLTPGAGSSRPSLPVLQRAHAAVTAPHTWVGRNNAGMVPAEKGARVNEGKPGDWRVLIQKGHVNPVEGTIRVPLLFQNLPANKREVDVLSKRLRKEVEGEFRANGLPLRVHSISFEPFRYGVNWKPDGKPEAFHRTAAQGIVRVRRAP